MLNVTTFSVSIYKNKCMYIYICICTICFCFITFFRQTPFVPNTSYITHLLHQAYFPKKYLYSKYIANTFYTKKYLNQIMLIPHICFIQTPFTPDTFNIILHNGNSFFNNKKLLRWTCDANDDNHDGTDGMLMQNLSRTPQQCVVNVCHACDVYIYIICSTPNI